MRVDVDSTQIWEGHDPGTIEVLDGDKVIASGTAGELIKIPGAKLWSPDDPFLYDLKASPFTTAR